MSELPTRSMCARVCVCVYFVYVCFYEWYPDKNANCEEIHAGIIL